MAGSTKRGLGAKIAERRERQRDRVREREGATRRPRASAGCRPTRMRPSRKTAGDPQPVRMCSTPSFSIDHAVASAAARDGASRCRRASRWRAPRSSTFTCALPARKTRAMWRCPGASAVEQRQGQREPIGNLGARVADLEDGAALGLEHPRPIERAGAGLAVGAHGQPGRDRARDGSRPAASSSASIAPSWFVSIAGSQRASSRPAIPRSP